MIKNKINRILIANRGEIARRIIRTTKKMGIESVTLYTNDEADAAWKYEADLSINLGNGGLKETYLNIENIIAIAKANYCDAIHPGYGFLAENAELAKACAAHHIIFIGPTSHIINLMGNKLKARDFVKSIGIPLPQGFSGTPDEILTNKNNIKFPVIIKAAAGGGGKGMQIVNSLTELEQKIKQASQEAAMWFANDEVFIEQYFENARHIEVQVLSDHHGNHLHLFERECTIQRKHQKIIEEAPSPTLSSEQRNAICQAAIKITKAVNYSNAGTIEFLWEEGQFYFLEMNTRIQVEHTVTEQITGIDLIEQQIKIAQNDALQLQQKELSIRGHAIEARIYAEQAHLNFKPSAGFMHCYQEDKNIPARYESTYTKPTETSTDFDGLICKIITHENNRQQAAERLKKVIGNTLIHGIYHNGIFLQQLLNHPLYIKNALHTKFIDQHFTTLTSYETLKNIEILFAAIITFENQKVINPKHIWHETNGFENQKHYRFLLENKSYLIGAQSNEHGITINHNKLLFNFLIEKINNNELIFVLNGKTIKVLISKGKESYWIQYESQVYTIKSQHCLNYAVTNKRIVAHEKKDYFEIKSPLHGKVSNIYVKINQKVKQGEPLLSIESMKTDNQIICPMNGLVDKIFIENNNSVKENQILISFKN